MDLFAHKSVIYKSLSNKLNLSLQNTLSNIMVLSISYDYSPLAPLKISAQDKVNLEFSYRYCIRKQIGRHSGCSRGLRWRGRLGASIRWRVLWLHPMCLISLSFVAFFNTQIQVIWRYQSPNQPKHQLSQCFCASYCDSRELVEQPTSNFWLSTPDTPLGTWHLMCYCSKNRS